MNGQVDVNTLWLQHELIRRHRLDDRESFELRSEVWRTAPKGLSWPAETVASELDAVRQVAARQPFNSTYLLALPYTATRQLPDEQRAALAGRWLWFADRADQLGFMWPGPSPDLALIFERLLPAAPGSPDPHRVFSDRCPLAVRLRSALPLTDPATGELFGLCEQVFDRPPADQPALLAQVSPLLASGGAEVLRKVVLVALAHQPEDTTVWVRGRPERQRIWCRRSTQRLLGGALLALAGLSEPWVDPLLGAVGTQARLFQPARLGRRPPLLTDAVRALVDRKTTAAGSELDRIYLAYPEELRHWRWVIEKRLRR